MQIIVISTAQYLISKARINNILAYLISMVFRSYRCYVLGSHYMSTVDLIEVAVNNYKYTAVKYCESNKNNFVRGTLTARML